MSFTKTLHFMQQVLVIQFWIMTSKKQSINWYSISNTSGRNEKESKFNLRTKLSKHHVGCIERKHSINHGAHSLRRYYRKWQCHSAMNVQWPPLTVCASNKVIQLVIICKLHDWRNGVTQAGPWGRQRIMCLERATHISIAMETVQGSLMVIIHQKIVKQTISLDKVEVHTIRQ